MAITYVVTVFSNNPSLKVVVRKPSSFRKILEWKLSEVKLGRQIEFRSIDMNNGLRVFDPS